MLALRREDERDAGMSELKSCPFCGGEAKLYISSLENSDTTINHSICCQTPGCRASMFTALSEWDPDYDKEVSAFIDRWNTRAE